jgi:Rieske Fe-S protein
VDRRVVLGCGVLATVAGLAAGRRALAGAQPVPAPRLPLWQEGREPLVASALVPHRTYVFLYPYESTPCFLLHLGRAVAGTGVPAHGAVPAYDWPGGVGPDRAIVAYSAICPHAFTHPTREVAMIHYYAPPVPAAVAQRSHVISCCVHGSTFDPARGAIPLQPPAEIPLATVVLAWDAATDALHVEGLIGRPVFTEFFRSFPRSGRGRVEGRVPVWPLERYSSAVLNC